MTNNIVDPSGSSYSLSKPTHASTGGVPSMDLERVYPRQLSSGSTRGTQTVAMEIQK